MSDINTLGRNDALSKSKRFRSDMLGDPTRLAGIDSGAAKRVYNGNLATGATTLYTCPNWKRAISMPGLYLFHNPTAGAIAMDFHHVPAGGSVQTTNRMANITIAADETRFLFTSPITPTMMHVIMSGDSLVINPGGAGLNAWAIMQEIKVEAATFIGGAVSLNGVAATLITCPALRSAVLLNAHIHNSTAGALVGLMHIRESGVAGADANEVLGNTSYAGNSETTSDFGAMPSCGQGGIIEAQSGSAGLNYWANAILL